MQDGTAKISFFGANILMYHKPKLIGHEQLGQDHKELSFDMSNSCGAQKLNEIWLLT